MHDSKKRPLIAGNWKMHKTLAESRALAEEVLGGLEPERDVSVGLFPSGLSLAEVARIVHQAERAVSPGDASEDPSGDGAGDGATFPRFLVGAQNMHFESQGAFTGETSAEMIRAVGGNAVIIGHSERRHVFGEDDELIGKKVRKALDSQLLPILCVGETLDERDEGRTIEVVREQLRKGLALVEDVALLTRVIIAYEPVWAIGTGRTATPQQAQECHRFIRDELARCLEELRGPTSESDDMYVLYGGSVKPGNAGDLLAEPDIDGALVGGASLEPGSFLGICQASQVAAGGGCQGAGKE